MKLHPLLKFTLVIIFLFLFFAGLYYGRPFFVPITIAAILAMLMLPVCNWLEGRGMKRVWAVLICTLALTGVIVGVVSSFSDQVADFSDDFSNLEKAVTEKLDQAHKTIEEKLNIPEKKQEEMISSNTSSIEDSVFSNAKTFLNTILGLLANILLILVYVFLFLRYRGKFKRFLLRLAVKDKRERTKKVISETSKVVQQYLIGKLALIFILAVLYSIGLLALGIKHAVFFSVFAAVLSLIPYIGNLIGGALPALIALITKDSALYALGVVVVFSVAQFLESYILTPLIVGREVGLNPLFTILVVILGEIVWGIPGMIVAIPLLGIIKIIFDNVEKLQPFGYLVGDEKSSSGLSFKDKMKNWFS